MVDHCTEIRYDNGPCHGGFFGHGFFWPRMTRMNTDLTPAALGTRIFLATDDTVEHGFDACGVGDTVFFGHG